MKNRIITLFWSLFFLITGNLSAQTVSVWDGSSEIWTQGSGTEADPYLIETAANLAWIAEMVNAGVTTYEGVYFKMTTDLNMQNIAWVPIGNSETNLFCGKFNGDDHFIDNISITGSYTYAGPFGIIGDNVVIANTGVKSEVGVSRRYAGGIVGYIKGENTLIENCYNTGSISSSISSSSEYYPTYSGGIVGYCGGANARIENCYNTGSISSYSYSSSPSYSSPSPYSYSGGIFGGCEGASTRIKNCYNTGNISSRSVSSPSNSYASSPHSYSYSGGIAGYYNGASACIESCYNTGGISSYSYSSPSS